MARPTKWRKIENIPTIPYFIPSETDVAEVPENILKLEELEAIRTGRMCGKNGGVPSNFSAYSFICEGKNCR